MWAMHLGVTKPLLFPTRVWNTHIVEIKFVLHLSRSNLVTPHPHVVFVESGLENYFRCYSFILLGVEKNLTLIERESGKGCREFVVAENCSVDEVLCSVMIGNTNCFHGLANSPGIS